MLALDLLAIAAIATGTFLGARRGFWRILAGGGAVALGTAAGWTVSDILAAALRDWGVAPPGDAALGFFLPFALTSVYARFAVGLWLSRRLERCPEGNRLLGAITGAACATFAAGIVANVAGVHRDGPARAPFAAWLASGPGELVGTVLAPPPAAQDPRPGTHPTPPAGSASLGEAIVRAVDADNIHARARAADAEAESAWRGTAAPLRQ